MGDGIDPAQQVPAQCCLPGSNSMPIPVYWTVDLFGGYPATHLRYKVEKQLINSGGHQFSYSLIGFYDSLRESKKEKKRKKKEKKKKRKKKKEKKKEKKTEENSEIAKSCTVYSHATSRFGGQRFTSDCFYEKTSETSTRSRNSLSNHLIKGVWKFMVS